MPPRRCNGDTAPPSLLRALTEIRAGIRLFAFAAGVVDRIARGRTDQLLRRLPVAGGRIREGVAARLDVGRLSVGALALEQVEGAEQAVVAVVVAGLALGAGHQARPGPASAAHLVHGERGVVVVVAALGLRPSGIAPFDSGALALDDLGILRPGGAGGA